jgi:hypothetical protein
MKSLLEAYAAFIKKHGMNLFSRDDETIAKRSFEAGFQAATPEWIPLDAGTKKAEWPAPGTGVLLLEQHTGNIFDGYEERGYFYTVLPGRRGMEKVMVNASHWQPRPVDVILGRAEHHDAKRNASL